MKTWVVQRGNDLLSWHILGSIKILEYPVFQQTNPIPASNWSSETIPAERGKLNLNYAHQDRPDEINETGMPVSTQTGLQLCCYICSKRGKFTRSKLQIDK